MHKQVSLIRESFIPEEIRNNMTTIEKYEYFRKLYDSGMHHVLLNDISIFGPYPKAKVPWDISESQKIATYNKEIIGIIRWIQTRILLNLAIMNYKTLYVLIRVATGMLNKCNIPKEIQIMFHDNMVKNLQKEHNEIIMSDLPF